MIPQFRQYMPLARLLVLEGLVVLLGFLFTIAATRMVGVDGYGQIAYAIAIGNVLSAAMRYGTDETLIVSMMRSDQEWLEIVAVTLLRAALYVIAALALAAVWLGGIVTGKEALAAAAFLLIGMQLVAQYDYLGQQHRHNFAMVGNKAVLLLVFAGLATTTGLQALDLFIIASLIANVGLLAVHYRFFNRNFANCSYQVDWPSIGARLKALLRSNFAVMFASLMSLGLYSANQIYIKLALSFEALAIFAVQWQVCNVFLIYMKQVNRMYKPVLALQYRDGSALLSATRWKFFAMVTLPPTAISLLIWLNYDAIFPRLFTASLAGYGSVFLILTAFVFLRGIHLTLTQISYAAAKNHVPSVANAVGLVLIGAVIVVLQGYDQIEDGVIAMNIAMLGMIATTLLFLCPFSRFENIRD